MGNISIRIIKSASESGMGQRVIGAVIGRGRNLKEENDHSDPFRSHPK